MPKNPARFYFHIKQKEANGVFKDLNSNNLKPTRVQQEQARQQRQQAIERAYTEQAQGDLLEAMQKRKELAAAERQKSKKIKIIVWILIVLAAVALTIKITKDNEYRRQPRNFAVDEMDDSFSNVYTDVVSIDPVYFVYEYPTTKYGTKVGDGELVDVICCCETVEGKTVWAAIFAYDFPDTHYSKNEDDYWKHSYAAKHPMRLFGFVDTAKQTVEGLEAEIGNVFVLDVTDLKLMK